MAKGWQGIVVRNPSELGYESRRPYKFACSKDLCYWHVSCKDAEDAFKQYITHPCPWWGGQTKVSWNVARTLVEQMWDKLDIEYQVLAAEDFKNVERKARARAIAECIVLFMQPHFTNPDDVIREAKRRYEGDEDYETPGLGARRYESAATELVKIREEYAEKRKTRTPRSAPNPADKVDDQTKEAIKAALNFGLPADKIASTYRLPLAVIEAIAKG